MVRVASVCPASCLSIYPSPWQGRLGGWWINVFLGPNPEGDLPLPLCPPFSFPFTVPAPPPLLHSGGNGGNNNSHIYWAVTRCWRRWTAWVLGSFGQLECFQTLKVREGYGPHFTPHYQVTRKGSLRPHSISPYWSANQHETVLQPVLEVWGCPHSLEVLFSGPAAPRLKCSLETDVTGFG